MVALPSNAIAAPKLATVVARQIENQVIALGWPVGQVLGSETELLEHFGVSRAVLREAVRIVEHTGAAQMRRGPGGGLVVSAPDRNSVTTSIGIWFSYVGVTAGEIFDARSPLFVEAVRSAAERRPAEGIPQLRRQLTQMKSLADLDSKAFFDLDIELAGLSDNPAVSLLTDAMSSLLNMRLRRGKAKLEALKPKQAGAHLLAYDRLAERIDVGDVEGAVLQAHQLLSAVRVRLRDRSGPSVATENGSPKLAERVVVALLDDIEQAGWPVDAVLGSEPELIARYEVSRAILREAVRLLEHDGAVRTKRGPGGGLVVAEPDRAAIVRAVDLALEHAKVTPRQLVAVRSALEVAAVRMAADSASAVAAAALVKSATADQSGGDGVGHLYELHHLIAEASGSRPLGLLVRVMSELVDRHMVPTLGEGGNLDHAAAQTRQAHRRVVEAIAAGDADLAERRMRRHLGAVLDLLR